MVRIDNVILIKAKNDSYYIFDGLSNNIYELGGDIDISYITKDSIMDILEYSSLLRVNPLIVDRNVIDSNVNSNAQTLIIELTEKCNLRCSYCVFDESNSIDRNHSEKTNKKEVNFSKIDNFIERCGSEGCVVFYGGEPTIEFDKIKNIVSYVAKANKKISFSITTNAYSLTNEMISFFIKNHFFLNISIDGDKQIHDSRRITVNGQGTHERISKNIFKIKEADERFFMEKVSINCVINESRDINKINEYFNRFELNQSAIRFSPEITKSNEINEAILDSISKSLIESKNKDDFGLIEKEYFDLIYTKIIYRNLDDKAKSGKKICIPYSNRTYLRNNGDIQFCERIGDFSKESVNSISPNLSFRVIKQYSELKENDCKTCFAYNFCEFCPASFIYEGKLKNNKSKCDIFRRSVALIIEYYINESVH